MEFNLKPRRPMWPATSSMNFKIANGLLPDTQNCGLRMRLDCRERFPRHRLQRKPLVSDPDMHHGTCVTHVPWCMSGSLNRGCGENVPAIPGACATRNITYLVRGPWCGSSRTLATLEQRVFCHIYHFCVTYGGYRYIYLQKVTCVGPAMHVLMIYPILCMMWTWSLSDASTCKPLVIERHNSVCAEALAAGSYPKCSSKNATVERVFCEMSSLDDLDTLLNVARVLGHNDASIQIHVAIYIIWVMFEGSSRKMMKFWCP